MRFLRSSFRLLAIVCLLSLASLGLSQQKQGQDQDEPIRLKADLVSVPTSVTDATGRPVRSLNAENFSVFEDGIKQKLTHFASTEAPFSLMLLIDVSGSTADDVALMKTAASNFLSELQSEDRVAVIVFSGDVELIADFGDSRATVRAAVDSISPPRGREGHRFGPNTGTSFYDALYLAADESPLKHAEGRKAVVCMSDGVDSSSKTGYAEAARLIEKSEISVYFLELNTEQAMVSGLLKQEGDAGYIRLSKSQINRYYDETDRNSPQRFLQLEAAPPSRLREMAAVLYRIARRELREIASHTGGQVYAVKSLNDLTGVYKQIAEDLRSQYLLGYYPSNGVHDGKWRTIRVEVNRSGAGVRARSGYRAPAS